MKRAFTLSLLVAALTVVGLSAAHASASTYPFWQMPCSGYPYPATGAYQQYPYGTNYPYGYQAYQPYNTGYSPYYPYDPSQYGYSGYPYGQYPYGYQQGYSPCNYGYYGASQPYDYPAHVTYPPYAPPYPYLPPCIPSGPYYGGGYGNPTCGGTCSGYSQNCQPYQPYPPYYYYGASSQYGGYPTTY